MSRSARIDQDALIRNWPALFAATPLGEEFVKRDTQLEIELRHLDAWRLEQLAPRFRCTAAGVVLQVLFEFVYGYYALARMCRERSGLFKGFPSVDPAPWSSLEIDDRGFASLAMPIRLRTDLEAMARPEGLSGAQLAGLIIQRYLDGHLPDALGEK